MNIKALITTFAILGSSSVAMARPATFSAQATWSYGTQGPVVRDHRTPVQAPVVVRHQTVRPSYAPDTRWGYYQPRSILLADALHFNSGETRKFVTIGAAKGAFRQLNIEAAGGQFLLKQLRIDFANGEYQIIRNIDRVLAGNAMYTASLDGQGRAITRVIVYGENNTHGWAASSAAINLTAR